MIYPVILHHDSSTKYTKMLVNGLDRKYSVVDSSKLETHFTESFNIGIVRGLLKTYRTDYTHIMICNNDIKMDEDDLLELDKIVAGKDGIFSPALNSPHTAVMSPKSSDELRVVPWIEFVAPIFSRNVLKKVGILDELMPRGWGVELDYCFRAKNRGYETSLCQNRVIHHYGGKSYSEREKHCHISNAEMNDRLSEKYGENWQEILQYPQW